MTERALYKCLLLLLLSLSHCGCTRQTYLHANKLIERTDSAQPARYQSHEVTTNAQRFFVVFVFVNWCSDAPGLWLICNLNDSSWNKRPVFPQSLRNLHRLLTSAVRIIDDLRRWCSIRGWAPLRSTQLVSRSVRSTLARVKVSEIDPSSRQGQWDRPSSCQGQWDRPSSCQGQWDQPSSCQGQWDRP